MEHPKKTVILAQLTRSFNNLYRKFGRNDIAKRELLKQIRNKKYPFSKFDTYTVIQLAERFGKDK